MKDFGTVRSTVRPQEKVVDENSVWINTQIQEICQGEGENAFCGFAYHQVRYGKDEYISLLDEKNAALEAQMTDAQLALCELYERM